ncbi:MAG: hypothetical protein JOZ68_09875 [Acidimicrobiia bacterium]|nr:hypothetical protein [Acidimicrobiia bacterium]
MLAAGRDIRERPVWLHALVLAVLLLAILPFTRMGGALISDEGSAALQARTLNRDGTWILHQPLARIDPQDRADPLPYVEAGPKGRAPYAKHPLYPLLLAGASRLAGNTGYYLLSLAGTVLAAIGAAALARRIGTRPALSLWVAGVGTPLFFYAFVLQAHSLGAAAAVAAMVGALAALEKPTIPRLVAIFGLIAFAAALRSEADLFAGGVAIGALVVGWKGRRGAAVAVAVVAAAAPIVVRLVEREFLIRVVGSGAAAVSAPGKRSGLTTPIRGFYSTWLAPTNQGNFRLGVALAIALGLVAGAALAARRPGRASVVVACLGGALVAYVSWFVKAPAVPVDGLAIVFPAGWAAIWAFGRSELERPASRFAVVALVVFVLAVVLTQYPEGGGPEWGGRYFLVGLAVAAPVAIVVLVRVRGQSLAVASASRAALALCVMIAVVIAWGGVRALRQTHANSKELLAVVEKAGRSAPSPFGPHADRRPVVVTTVPLIPQLLWEGYDRFQWLAPSSQDLAEYGQRLAAAGTARLVLIAADAPKDVPSLAPWYRELARPEQPPGTIPPYPVIVMERR